MKLYNLKKIAYLMMNNIDVNLCVQQNVEGFRIYAEIPETNKDIVKPILDEFDANDMLKQYISAEYLLNSKIKQLKNKN